MDETDDANVTEPPVVRELLLVVLSKRRPVPRVVAVAIAVTTNDVFGT